MSKPRAIGLKEAAYRLGLSYSSARRRVAEGTFPVPSLPRRGNEWWKFSEYEIERYLDSASTADALRFA